jgi:glycosyltransferase involved in cell wall biosynthesis
MEQLSGRKILFVITKSNWGGAQSYVHTLATYCHSQGADVAVALGGTGLPKGDTGMLAARLADSGIRVLVVPSFVRELSFFQELRAFWELLTIIRQERPDVLHLNSGKAGGIGALAGRLVGVERIVFTAHGWAHREPRSLLWKLIVWKFSWWTITLSHAVIVVSNFDYRNAPVLFSRHKLHVVYNGVAPFALLPRVKARQELIKKAPTLSETVPWLVMPAELHTNKGIDLAIEALARLSLTHPDMALVVLGEGDERETLLQRARECGVSDRVFLLGFVPDARQHLSAADLFLMPSRKEGFPLALLEAAHAALPVVATRVGGIPEIVEHEKNGLLTTPNDVAELATSIDRLLKDPDEARSLGIALQATVREKFSEGNMLTETFSLY